MAPGGAAAGGMAPLAAALSGDLQVSTLPPPSKALAAAAPASPFACESAGGALFSPVGGGSCKAKRSLSALLPPAAVQGDAPGQHVTKERKAWLASAAVGPLTQLDTLLAAMPPLAGGAAACGEAALMDVDTLIASAQPKPVFEEEAQGEEEEVLAPLPGGVARVLAQYGGARIACGSLDGIAHAARRHIAASGTAETFYV